MNLHIAHLYPELLNLYGDRGNIISMKKRLEWRGIEANVCEYKLSDPIDFTKTDIVFIGGGSDREQQLVAKRLHEIKASLLEYVEQGGVVVAICGGYQLLGKFYQLKDEVLEGLGILNIHTKAGTGRLIGNVVIRSPLFDRPIVGFENHGGRTYTQDHTPFGTVLYGSGNNGEDKKEGTLYKNVIGTYLHGPLLPKNPHVCDYILQKALEQKYKNFSLKPLDDKTEDRANQYIVDRFLKG